MANVDVPQPDNLKSRPTIPTVFFGILADLAVPHMA
jgi:hypothetical protein